MTQPIILPSPGTPLYRQIIRYLGTDTNPALGLVAALGGQSAQSIYPNFTTDGPSDDRAACPFPFVVVYPGGTTAKTPIHRELRILVEIHEDVGEGDQRWPGILARIKWLLVVSGWRPQNDEAYNYSGGIAFESESPPNLPDMRYGPTSMVQIIFIANALDRTSGYGRNG